MKRILLSVAVLLGMTLATTTVVNAQDKAKKESCCKKTEEKEKSCCSDKGDKGGCEKDAKASKTKKGKKKAQ